jgi:hypothetical protein
MARTFNCVLACSGALHVGYKSIPHRGASRNERACSRERTKWPMYDEIRTKFALPFNKTSYLNKLKNKMSVTGSVLDLN